MILAELRRVLQISEARGDEIAQEVIKGYHRFRIEIAWFFQRLSESDKILDNVKHSSS